MTSQFPPDAVFIVATLTAKEGKLDDVIEGMKQLAAKVEENEPGCLSYGILANTQQNKLIIMEAYKDQEAAVSHGKQPYMAEAREKGSENLAEPVQITFAKGVGGFRRSG